jgi:hypothetical protein
LVTGRISETESSSWKAPRPSLAMGTPLLRQMTGSEPQVASNSPVAMLVIPGPGFPKHTAGPLRMRA